MYVYILLLESLPLASLLLASVLQNFLCIFLRALKKKYKKCVHELVNTKKCVHDLEKKSFLTLLWLEQAVVYVYILPYILYLNYIYIYIYIYYIFTTCIQIYRYIYIILQTLLWLEQAVAYIYIDFHIYYICTIYICIYILYFYYLYSNIFIHIILLTLLLLEHTVLSRKKKKCSCCVLTCLWVEVYSLYSYFTHSLLTLLLEKAALSRTTTCIQVYIYIHRYTYIISLTLLWVEQAAVWSQKKKKYIYIHRDIFT
jgi:hypothetical protein